MVQKLADLCARYAAPALEAVLGASTLDEVLGG
jgi:hypothetical protein